MTSNNRKIKVLIVDDSMMFCTALGNKIGKNEDFEVVGFAHDPYEARDKILSLRPDVMTLDIEMPRMDGVRFLKQLMPQYPIPTIIFSSLPKLSSDAVKAGALEFVEKPGSVDGLDRSANRICEIFRAVMSHKTAVSDAHRTETVQTTAYPPLVHSQVAAADSERKIIALGASTGGTDALEVVLMKLPADCPPIVLVQHMPPVFTKMYAERLDKNCKMKVSEAVNGVRLHRGMCVVAAGDSHLRLKRDAQGYYIESLVGPKVSGHCPSVDVLFDSVADVAAESCVAAILTGMGADGAVGLKKLHDRGAFTVGQNKESCVVYGMPMEAYKLGAVDVQCDLQDIANEIMKHI